MTLASIPYWRVATAAGGRRQAAGGGAVRGKRGEHDVQIALGTIWRLSNGVGSRAKKTAYAIEQDRPDILERGEEWFEGGLDLDRETLVFIH